jgi:predicted nucleic acid-binding protein
MNGNKILLDTNVILYLLNVNTDIRDILNKKQFYISFITELELLGYKDLTAPDKEKIKEFIKECTIIDVNASIKNKVVEIRINHKIKLPDALVAATAYFLDIPLLTADKGLSALNDMSVLLYEK